MNVYEWLVVAIVAQSVCTLYDERAQRERFRWSDVFWSVVLYGVGITAATMTLIKALERWVL